MLFPKQIGTAADEEKGFGLPRANPKAAKDGLVTAFTADDDQKSQATTLWEVFQLGLARNPSANFLGTRAYQVETAPAAAEAPAADAAPAPSAEGEGEEKKAAPAKKPRKPSGYKERADGSIQRFGYVWDSYQDVNDSAIAIGRGLLELGLKASDNVGIFSINRAEWITASLGFYSQNLRTVSLYATLGPDAVEYIINHAQTSVVFVSKENLPGLKKVIPKIDQVVKHIVVFDVIYGGRYGNTLDTVQQADVDAFAEKGIKLLGLQALMDLGNAKTQVPLNLPKADDLAFIMYTSGTTGVPKGALLTHRNIVSDAGAASELVRLNVGDVYFSYLPLAHIFETVAQCFVWAVGGQVAFTQGDIRHLISDLQECRPMLFCGVPRVFLKFYQNVWATIEKSSCIKKWYVNRAYRHQCARLAAHEPLDPSYDSNVFALMREKMGLSRVRVLVTGAAPCPPYLIEFMKVVSNAYFAQGYGLTETSAGCCIVLPDDNRCGHVGPPISSNYVRLADIPDMKYFSTDNPPRGEVLVHGPSVFQGYYKDQKNTDDAFVTDAQGRKWLCTGDVGRWNPNGSLSIIDRKKNMIKLAQGEYVAVEKVEDVYNKAPCVSQMWVYGNSYKSVAVGVVVLNAQNVYDFAVQQGFIPASTPAPIPGALTEEFIALYEDLCTGEHRAAIKTWAWKQLKDQEGTLLGFEKIKDLHIEGVIDTLGMGFTEANDCLTPTMKKKRKPLTEKYLPILKEMYIGLGEKPQDGEKW